MSSNIAVIYTSDLEEVASVFGEAAGHLARSVRLLSLADSRDTGAGTQQTEPDLRILEWADGIALGTPIGDGRPAGRLMAFLAATEPLWSSGRLWDKVATVFTDEPERFAPDSVLHPIYDALYQWGAVIVGPRALELGVHTQPGGESVEQSVGPALRLRATQYRAVRLTRLAGVIADQRHARERLML